MTHPSPLTGCLLRLRGYDFDISSSLRAHFLIPPRARAAAISIARPGLYASADGGKVFVIGGFTGGFTGESSDVHVYDTAAKTWSTLDPAQCGFRPRSVFAQVRPRLGVAAAAARHRKFLKRVSSLARVGKRQERGRRGGRGGWMKGGKDGVGVSARPRRTTSISIRPPLFVARFHQRRLRSAVPRGVCTTLFDVLC